MEERPPTAARQHADAAPMDDGDPIAALAAVPLLADIAPRGLQQILDGGVLVDVEGGEVIVEEGASGSDLFVVLDGAARVLVEVEGDRVEVAGLSRGDVFGDLGVLLAQPRLATVMATTAGRVLRVSRPALERLLEEVPGLALALARDLAGRLQHALGQGNEAAVRDTPDAVTLATQDLTRMRSYMARYYVSAVRNVTRRHRLILDRAFPRYECTFTVTEDERRRWFSLFDVDDEARHAPFTYYTSSGTLLLMRIVEDVGVNFRHLLHLRTDMTFAATGAVTEPGIEHRLTARLADVVRFRDDKVVLVVESRIEGPDRSVVQLDTQRFVVLNVDPSALELLQASSARPDADPTEPVMLPRHRPLQADGPEVRRIPWEVPEDMGMRYGRVSGDLNLVHTTRAGARLFGHPKPFVQGLCTANFALRHLTAVAPSHLLGVQLAFARPLFVGQTVHLIHDDRVLEFRDDAGELLAYGRWRAA
jgi:CRP-like cAMP-binding protein